MRGPVRVILKNPALTYGLIGLTLNLLVHATRAAYDAGGLEGLLFWTAQLFGLPFWAVSEAMFSLTEIRPIPARLSVSVVLGLALCLLFDFVIRGVVRWRRIGTSREIPLKGPSRVFLKNPVLTFGLTGLVLNAASDLAICAYDSGGWKGLLYWTAAFFYLPCLLVGDLLFWLYGGHAPPGHIVISIVGGLLLCLLFDFVLRGIVWWRWRAKARRTD